MDPAQDPKNMGEMIAGGIPGASLLAAIRQMGQKIPENMDQVMQMLGIKQAPPPINQPLPRHGGFDANGQPIIIPPQGRTY